MRGAGLLPEKPQPEVQNFKKTRICQKKNNKK
jgi:hypothetical protein